jgi:diguanylate cyclase (GGDEF)-like protein/PAS domain S-box-containing protein
MLSSAKYRPEVAMLSEKDFYKELIDNLYDGVYFVDRNRVITYWNKGAERITGYSAHQAIGRPCRDNMLNHVTANGAQLCGDSCPLAACMEDGQPRKAEVFLHHANGYRVPVVVHATVLRNEEGKIIGAIESFYNNESVITTRRQLSEMRRAVLVDPLTGISNRRHLEGRLRAMIAESEHTNMGVGLLFIDVDRFKEFNDNYGHEIGDRILCMVANDLRHNLRTTDTVGRWGGDEFVAIVSDVGDSQNLRSIATKLKQLVECSRLDLEDKNLFVTISVGATLLLPDDTHESFVRRADRLMFYSKSVGRNLVTVG